LRAEFYNFGEQKSLTAVRRKPPSPWLENHHDGKPSLRGMEWKTTMMIISTPSSDTK